MSSSTLLWYNSPAKAWTQSLPIGNGTLGAMIYGTVDKEILALNHDELWTGKPKNTIIDGAPESPASVVRNITYELVESQITGYIPTAKVDPKMWSEKNERLAKSIETRAITENKPNLIANTAIIITIAKIIIINKIVKSNSPAIVITIPPIIQSFPASLCVLSQFSSSCKVQGSLIPTV